MSWNILIGSEEEMESDTQVRKRDKQVVSERGRRSAGEVDNWRRAWRPSCMTSSEMCPRTAMAQSDQRGQSGSTAVVGSIVWPALSLHRQTAELTS